MNSEVFNNRFYAKQVDLANTVVKSLRKEGVPSYLFGGLAVDMVIGEKKFHKDIDIFIVGYGDEMIARTHNVLLGLGLRLIGEEFIGYNQLWKEVWVFEDEEHMIGVDVFYGSFADGHLLPIPIEYHESDPIIIDVPILIYTEMIGVSALKRVHVPSAQFKMERLKKLLSRLGIPSKLKL